MSREDKVFYAQMAWLLGFVVVMALVGLAAGFVLGSAR